MIPHSDISSSIPKDAQAVTFDHGVSWRAVVKGQLQKPTFNDRGPALIFAQQVFCKLRSSEPVEN